MAFLDRRAAIASTIAVSLAAALPAIAQSYPARTITLVVGYSPGGTGDFITPSRARIQLKLPLTVLISPLWATMR